MSDQTIKQDNGKVRLSLVPEQMLYDVARVMEYGVGKYGEGETWRKAEPQWYREALMRHVVAYIHDPAGVDAESGIEHYKHIASNAAILCELEKKQAQMVMPIVAWI